MSSINDVAAKLREAKHIAQAIEDADMLVYLIGMALIEAEMDHAKRSYFAHASEPNSSPRPPSWPRAKFKLRD